MELLKDVLARLTLPSRVDNVMVADSSAPDNGLLGVYTNLPFMHRIVLLLLLMMTLICLLMAVFIILIFRNLLGV